MKRVFGWGPTLAVFALFSAYTAVYSWPATWWFDARSVTVFDAAERKPIQMLVDRTINRPFVGEWNVLVRRADPDGMTVKCQARGTGNYRVDSTFPVPLTLEWWTSGECPSLPQGRYIMTTVWRLPGFLGIPKVIAVDSNPFTVHEPSWADG